jgi:hypothetical protein
MALLAFFAAWVGLKDSYPFSGNSQQTLSGYSVAIQVQFSKQGYY